MKKDTLNIPKNLTLEEALNVMHQMHNIISSVTVSKSVSTDDLTRLEIKILMFISRNEIHSLKEIKEILYQKKFELISKARLDVKVTKLINNLIKKGCVTKESSPEDKRIALIHVTPKGETISKNIYKAVKQKWEARND